MKGGLMVGLLVIIMATAGINKVVINRMAYDVNSALKARQVAVSNQLNRELVNKSKTDLHKSQIGYTDNEGINHLENKLNESVSSLTLTSFSMYHSIDNLYIKSDKGSALTQPFNYFEWNYSTNNMGWDGEKFTSLPPNYNDYRLYKLNIGENYTEGLDYIYNLEFYEPLDYQPNLPYINLDGGVGILVKIEDGSVKNYTILNSDIQDYDNLQVIDFKGNKMYEISREVLRDVFTIPGTESLEEYTGHYITINCDPPNYIKGIVLNSPFTKISSILGEQIISEDSGEFQLDLAKGMGEITIEIYGTDVFTLELGYSKLMKY